MISRARFDAVREQDTARLSISAHAHALLVDAVAHFSQKAHALLDHPKKRSLHDARVALRRVRTLVHAFAPVLLMPAGADEPTMRKAGRLLGKARDAEVISESLRDAYLPRLPSFEAERIRAVLRLDGSDAGAAPRISKKARIATARIVAALERAVDAPRFEPLLGARPCCDTLPALAHRLEGEFSLHRAWELPGPEDDPDALHALRKRGKRLRYFTEANADALARAGLQDMLGRTDALKDLQAILGDLTDIRVLRAWLEDRCGPRWEAGLPVLARAMARARSPVGSMACGEAGFHVPRARRGG